MTADLLVKALRDKNWSLATAESCTGGLLAGAITDVAGSSCVFDRGFVTYSNAAKADMLGIPLELIEQHGAVSEVIARKMAEGALMYSNADISVAITGIAGPGGGSTDKPLGLVHFACATKNKTKHSEVRFGDLGRAVVRQAAVKHAVQMVLLAL
jgi:nicotinamide-nucleotide amidase